MPVIADGFKKIRAYEMDENLNKPFGSLNNLLNTGCGN